MAQNLTLENQNDAQEQEVNGTGLLPLFHSAIVEQRGATEELRAVSRELQTILNDILTAKPELRVAYQELLVEPDSEASHRQTTTATPAMNLAQLKREAKRNLRKSRELIRESARVRLHSKTLRAALRGARRFKPDSGTNG